MKYKCKYCKQKYEKLRIKIPQVCFDDKCLSEYNDSKKEKLKKTKIKKHVSIRKRSSTSLSSEIQKTREVFHAYIKKRDEKKNCITCDSKSGPFDAGHCFKAEVYSGLIFNEMNCHKQCEKCNRFNNGEVEIYKQKIIEIYGQSKFNELQKEADLTRVKKYSREELFNIQNKYK